MLLIRTGQPQPQAGFSQRKRHTLKKTLRKRSVGSRCIRRVTADNEWGRDRQRRRRQDTFRAQPDPRTIDALRWVAWAAKPSVSVLSCIERIRAVSILDNLVSVVRM